jgi:hypothetical protein
MVIRLSQVAELENLKSRSAKRLHLPGPTGAVTLNGGGVFSGMCVGAGRIPAEATTDFVERLRMLPDERQELP